MKYLKLNKYSLALVLLLSGLSLQSLLANNSNTTPITNNKANSPADDFQTLSDIYMELISRPTCDGLAHDFNWDLSAPMGTWEGVTVDPISGCVTVLEITGKRLTGPIPPQIGDLSQLVTFSLTNNCFTGSIPPELGQLSAMDDFQLDNNLLTGTIPDELCNLTNVRVFYLDNNMLTGSLPECFNDLDLVTNLDLFHNCLDALPDLSGMAGLGNSRLVIHNNKLTFDDILPNLSDSWGKHHPQDSVCVESTVILTTGSNYGIDLGIDADVVNNSYQWYKDGVQLGGPTNINTLSFNPVTFATAGTYHCRITNPDAPQLILHSRAKNIEVVCGTSTYYFTPDVCDDYEVVFEGVTFNADFPCGIVDTPEPDQFTCDSIISVCLNFISPPTVPFDTTICFGDSIVINGNTYNNDIPGGLEFFHDENGCDTLLMEVQVFFFPEAVSDYTETICKNDTTAIHGQLFHFGDSIGQVILTDQSFHGCDSIINIDIDFWPEATGTYSDTLCIGESITVNGSTYNANYLTGTDTIPNESWRGCDSIVTTTMTFFDEVIDTISIAVCPGQTIMVNDVSYHCNNITGTETIFGGSYTGCDSTVFVNLTCYEPPHGSYNPFVCLGGSIVYNGTTYDDDMRTGVENLGPIGFMGCDSLVDVQLDFYPPATSTIDTLLCPGELLIIGNIEIENGDSYVLEGASFHECDSTITVNIDYFPESIHVIDTSLCPGEIIIVDEMEVSSSGSYTLEGASFRECDSTIIVNIDYLPESITVIDDVLCPGSIVVVNDIIYDESNTNGRDTLSNFYGCDSIIIIDISYGNSVVVNIEETLCPGDSLIIGGIVYNEDNNIFTDTIPNGSFSGCDSITNITISYFPEAISQLNPVLCSGDSLVIGSLVINEEVSSGMVILTGESFYGCDSTIHINATFLIIPVGEYHTSLCAGDSIFINSNWYHEDYDSGVETIPGGSFQQCDSSFTVTVDIYPTAFTLIDNTLCFGQSITVNNITYDENMPTGLDTLLTFQGCDSIISIALEFNNAVIVNNDPVLCDHTAEVIVNGNIYNFDNPMGFDTMTSYSGCDSIVITDLMFPDSEIVIVNSILCPGESITINGTEYNELLSSGEEIEIDGATSGCDLYYDIDLSFHPLSIGYFNDILCDGTDTLIHGVLFDENHTTDSITLEGAAYTNCDSILVVNMEFYPAVTFDLYQNLCPGEFITVNGNIYDEITPEGEEVFVGESYWGCDSTVYIHLNFGEAVVNDISPNLCPGDSININGITYDMDYPEGLDTIPTGSYSGCDSILNVVVNFLSSTYNTIDTTLCSGEAFSFNGTIYDESNLSGIDTLTGANFVGCDSIVNVNLAYYQSNDTVETTLCVGEDTLVAGVLFNEDHLSEEIVLLGAALGGCDSVIFVQIAFYPNYDFVEEASICAGENYEWNGVFYSIEGIYSDTLFNQSYSGCDSIEMLFLEVQTAEELGLANAGTDLNNCAEPLVLSANQPTGTYGYWEIISGMADLGNSEIPDMEISNQATEELLLVWTLSTSECPDYHSDTILIFKPNIPIANADSYSIAANTDFLPLNLILNDSLAGIDDWYLNLLDDPTGVLQNTGPGTFDYQLPPNLNNILLTFNYELCNEDCPETCDTALVSIQFAELPSLEFPNTITINGDGINDNFVIPHIENDPDLYPNNELIIFNRWGDVVFQRSPYENDWGGTNENGKILPQGTYYYVLRLDVGNGNIFRGDVTVLK